jgi:hypothetical protein
MAESHCEMTTDLDPGETTNLVQVPGGWGVQIGDHNKQLNQFIQPYIANVHVHAELVVHSAYLEQVKRIAPPQRRAQVTWTGLRPWPNGPRRRPGRLPTGTNGYRR